MPRGTIALARVEVGGALPRSPGRREVLFNSFIALINRARGAGKPLREPGPEGGREGGREEGWRDSRNPAGME